MNLVIDIGNSRTKVAIFAKDGMIGPFLHDELTITGLKMLLEQFPGTERAILSSVAKVDPSIIDYLRLTFPVFIELKPSTPIPVTNCYKTPETLGLDRLAAVIGGRELFPGRDLVVIDAGTAITFDLLESNGNYLGGNISPGMKSRFRALHEFTSKLPLIEESDQWPLVGQTTEEAIRAGVINGMIFEIDGMIDQLKKKYPEMQPLLTGGDAGFFERRLKNHIFVKFEITLIGLNRILEYNVEKL